NGSHAGLSGKLALRHPVQFKSLPRTRDVVSDIRLLTHQFVGFDDKASYITTNHLKYEVANDCGKHSSSQPFATSKANGIGDCDHRAEHQHDADQRQARQHDVRFSVSDSAENGVIFKDGFKAAEIYTPRNHQQYKCKGGGNRAPGEDVVLSKRTLQSAARALHKKEGDRNGQSDNGQEKQPTGT